MNLRALLDDPRARRLGLQIGAGVLAVVVLVAIGWTWFRWQEARGEAALAEAGTLVQQALAPQASVETRTKAIRALETVLSEHSHFSGVPQAAYLLANLRYAARQFPEARGAYETALAKGATGSVKALSAVGIGYTWEAEKNYGNAATAYEAALRGMSRSDFLYEDTLVALARSQELGGKPAAAIETYQRVLEDVPSSRRAEDLKARLADLKSRPAK